MHHDGHLFCQSALQDAASGILLVLFHKCIDDIFLQRGENLDIALGIVVAHIQPELIELIRCGALWVEPDVSALGLTKLLAVALRDERTGEGEGLYLVAQCAANQFRTRGHVAPLVVAAKLQLHAIMLIEIEEVVALQQLIGELGERESVAGSTVEALLNRLFGHHIVHGDVLTHLTCKVEEGEVFHPVVVVHHDGSVGFFRLEVEELGHLALNALLVVAQRLVVQQVALLAFARRVANHAGGTTHKDDGLVAAALQVAQHHDATQMADMQ